MVDRLVDDIVVTTDEEIRRAVILLLEKTHHLAEGAGAAGTAGVVKLRERLAGRRVGTILSGGNLNREVLERALTDAGDW
jgi:threonine dehydratase